ncbi:hypothetical protein [Algibacter sp. R77976]|uniref:hypothetical protein n=1 Tax=Algibacter sp. R77976 TaxID=3093873 RepID=UPI0037C645C2
MKILLKNISFAIGIMFCSMNILCEEADDVDSVSLCDEITIVNPDLYENLNTANFTFIDAEIVDDCLRLEIGASGCDGNTWGFNLVDSGAIAESLPEQRYLRLQLINEEACLAFFEKTVSFDLSPIQIDGSNEIILHIEGLESSLNYKY